MKTAWAAGIIIVPPLAELHVRTATTKTLSVSKAINYRQEQAFIWQWEALWRGVVTAADGERGFCCLTVETSPMMQWRGRTHYSLDFSGLDEWDLWLRPRNLPPSSDSLCFCHPGGIPSPSGLATHQHQPQGHVWWESPRCHLCQVTLLSACK